MRPSPGLLALLGLSYVAGAQELTDVPTVENYVRRGSASATVIGTYVYVDGGEISQVVDGTPPGKQNYPSNPVNSTISIDLSKSWTTSDVMLRTIARPWYSKANQALWTDHSEGVFYVWGGKWIRGKNMTKNTLWKFTPDGSGGGAWSTEDAANPTLFDSLHQSEFGTFTNTNDTGFYIGGIASGWTEYHRASTQVLPGMVAFNMKTKTWHNGTTAFSPFDVLTAGLAHYVPNFGPNGLIMVFGGVANPVVGDPNWGTAPPFDLRNLTFFDPQTNRKYWQMATGDVPPFPRVAACVAGFQNPNGGYEIFLTGGENKRDKFVYDDAYVLSLPGFVWTKAPSSPSGKRAYSTCVSVGNRQMLSIGGTSTDWKDRDPAPQGLTLFDMTEMKWKDGYDASAAPYERANVIKSWYSNGSLDNVEWSSDEVRRMFVTKSTDPPPSSSPGASPSSTETPAPGTSSSSVSTGAIAGGVIGGVAGIAILAAAVWMFLRRRRQTMDPIPSTEPPDEPAPGYYGSEPTKGYELTGSKFVPPELNSNRDHVELGSSPTSAYPAGTYPAGAYPAGAYPAGTYPAGAYPADAYPAGSYMAPVEMDGTPRR